VYGYLWIEHLNSKLTSDSIHLHQALYEFLSCEAKQPLRFALMLTVQAPKEVSASKQVQVATVREWGTNRRPICTFGSLQSTAPDLKSQPPTTLTHEGCV